ncbi:MAG: hypothetical protein PHT41_07460 [Candidatus Omnitrophica bacterium]|nr:hypothetical protein [Candidatus Omnitrophota bacterium]MDD5238151.1 hypothetical protein [Candidatus Omnitrophota bacterium]
MKDKYPYLKDPRAIDEIRKHKWIESQKAGREIGFASAAVDWIKKYGKQWKEIYGKEFKDKSIFIERRRYRRFSLDCLAELIKNNILILAEVVDINFFGLLCKTDKYLQMGSKIGIHLLTRSIEKELICNGIIERVSQAGSRKYELFLKFDDYSQKQLENWGYFNRAKTLSPQKI